ncbi:UNVERIFIED_CONTAM: hypothetical protein RMT77_005448 [Armadillidium vulgare]|nr:Proteasome subunit beta type-1 [Armadillidium vulgare]
MALSLEHTEEYMRDPRKHQFSPYADNGGTSIAIAGDDFVMLASDTRLSQGYNVLSRNHSKCFKLTSETLLSSTGCLADVLTLTKILEARLTNYAHEHLETMSTTAIAQLLSTLLYWRRFFPYYVSNILVGFDEDGKGVVYHYDPVGHMEKMTYCASGAAVTLIQPLLDNLVGGKNMKEGRTTPITQDFAKRLIHDGFVSAAEREIATGDGCTIYTITKDDVTEETFKLRKD